MKDNNPQSECIQGARRVALTLTSGLSGAKLAHTGPQFLETYLAVY